MVVRSVATALNGRVESDAAQSAALSERIGSLSNIDDRRATI